MLFITESCSILLHFPLELIIAVFESILSTFTNSTPNSLPVLQIFCVCPNPLGSLAIFLAISPLESSTLLQPGLGGCATGLLHSCHVISIYCHPAGPSASLIFDPLFLESHIFLFLKNVLLPHFAGANLPVPSLEKIHGTF